MTDEHAEAKSAARSTEIAETDEDAFLVAARNIPALRREFDDRDVLVLACMHISPDSVAELAAASIYAKAFLETLGKRHAVSVDDLVRTRLRRKGKKTEVKIGLDGDAAAKIVVTADTPDEARLALLDLDVTADEVRGKTMRWDESVLAWLPADDE